MTTALTKNPPSPPAGEGGRGERATSHPIPFSGPMVRAILDGRKTQTRRVVKPRSKGSIFTIGMDDSYILLDGNKDWVMHDCPYGVPGDRLWVRETFYAESKNLIHYKADGWQYEDNPNSGWKPSIHMPRWASRITLEVVSVRVERVQDISEEDAIAEGIFRWTHTASGRPADRECWAHYEHEAGLAGRATAIGAFHFLWDSINAGRGFGWDANPWVWVIEFRRLP